MNQNSINRRFFLTASSQIVLSTGLDNSSPTDAKAPEQKSPNILWLIADDVGSKEIGCYGHPTIRTPNIDRLADQGVRFTHAFVTASSCSPSRCSLFTGKYPHSTGAENLHDPLPADQVILSELLAHKGYYSGNVGKFHMGSAAEKKFDVLYSEVKDWPRFFDKRPINRPFFLYMGFRDAHRPLD